ncbi:MAG: hypothetical protein M1819_000920 [Sarea resinae]|nr:MAG: hypothetical protein M1819_000920 [Sarea resinae]
MAQNPTKTPSFLQPRPKAPPTSNTSSLAATGTASNAPQLSRASSQHRAAAQQDPAKRPVDSTSDKATEAFIRRTLCAHQLQSNDRDRTTVKPLEELLPPLTSSNDVDLQLYAFIAIIIKEFIYSWYAKITPDHVFVDEVIQVFAHSTRALEQRLRKVDLETLLFDEIPELFEAHIVAYRMSHYPLHPPPLSSDPDRIYHSLHPHPALSPVPIASEPSTVLDQQQNETRYRQLLVQGALAVLLPTEDLENGCLRALVGEICGEMIIGNGLSGKVCEGWLLWEGITNIAKSLRTRMSKDMIAQGDMEDSKKKSQLERFGLLSSKEDADRPPSKPSTISVWFWTVLQYAFVALTTLRFMIVALATSSSLPSRTPVVGAQRYAPAGGERGQSPVTVASLPPPFLRMRIWSCITHLLELDWRMPWLSGILSLLQWGALAGPGRVGDTNGPLDRLFAHHVRTTILQPSLLPPLLLTLRSALFPSNTLAPARRVPSAAEQDAIKRACADALLDLVPAPLVATYLRPTTATARDEMVADVGRVLDLLGDSYANKHLVYAVLELVCVRLMPELAERGSEALLSARLGEGV